MSDLWSSEVLVVKLKHSTSASSQSHDQAGLPQVHQVYQHRHQVVPNGEVNVSQMIPYIMFYNVIYNVESVIICIHL